MPVPGLTETDQFEIMVCPLPRFDAAQATGFEGKEDIAEGAFPRVKAVVLKDHDVVGIGPLYLAAVDLDPAAARWNETGQQIDQGGLAATARADQADELAGGDLQIEARQGQSVFITGVTKAFFDTAQDNFGRFAGHRHADSFPQKRAIKPSALRIPR